MSVTVRSGAPHAYPSPKKKHAEGAAPSPKTLPSMSVTCMVCSESHGAVASHSTEYTPSGSVQGPYEFSVPSQGPSSVSSTVPSAATTYASPSLSPP